MARRARTFTRKRPLSAMTEINMTPLIDLAFSLLIIFMITTPLLEQSIEVNLPIQTASPAQPTDERVETITIDERGRVFWGADGERVDKVRLTALLAAVAQLPEQPVISVRADGRLPYQYVIDVVDLIKTQKLTKLSLETQPK